MGLLARASRRIAGRLPSLALALAPLALPLSAAAVVLPPGFSQTILNPNGGAVSATAMALAPDGRVFIAEQGGNLRVVKNGQLLVTPFLALSVDSVSERGLLGVTLDPAFATNGFVYVYYTVLGSPPHNRVSRFTANGDVAVAGSEVVLLELEPLVAGHHNGGALHFGPDGMLYVAVGDSAVPENAQSLGTMFGKMLRIGPDGSIPADNPFYNQTTGNNRAIWALGLRNPFTFAFQPGTGRMFINDVGEDTWEEINQGAAAANYGWPLSEGATSTPGHTGPVHAYAHTSPDCAIVGGTFYNPAQAQFPAEYAGTYFFADFCGNWIKRLDPATGTVTPFATEAGRAIDMAVAPDGSLYVLARSSGFVIRINYPTNEPPTISQHPADRTVNVGQAATFSVTVSGSQPLTYQWLRNGAPIAGATSASYTLASAALADNQARFKCTVTNSNGSVTSNEATLTVVQAPNTPPTLAAIANQTNLVGQAIAPLQLSAGDLDGDPLTYSASGLPPGLAIGPGSGAITGTPATAGTYTATATVIDGRGGSASRAFVWTINPVPNVAPQITTSAATTAAVGVAYSYDVNATDANGDTLTYSLTQAPTGMTINTTSGLIAWTPTAAQTGSQAVTVRVTDPGGLFVTQTYSITVTSTNVAPLVTTSAVTTAAVGVAYSYDVNATDANGDTLTYSLTQAPAGMTINTATGLIAWTPTSGQAGSQAVTVRVSDPGGLFVTQAFTITVTGGTAPSTTRVDLATPSTYAAAPGGTVPVTLNWYRVRMAANYLQFMHLVNAAGTVWSVDDHNTTSASWTTAPFSETRTIAVPANMPVGTYDIRVGLSGGNPWTDLTLVAGTGVTDPDGSHRYKVGTLTVATGAVAPQITTSAVTAAAVGVAYSYDVNASDANGDTLTYSLTQAPAGMTINASSGLIAWTPTAAQAGSQAVTVRVTDPGGLFATQAYSITVTAANVAPQITTSAVTTAAVGVAYSYDVNASDANGDTLTYSLTQAPAGMTINGSSGLIAWTPTAAQTGSQAVTVRVTDPGGLFVTQAYTITVTATNVAPQITTTALTTAAVGAAYSYDVNASDANGDTLTYSLTQAPTGMTINASTGLIVWTPTAAQAGSQAVTVRVADPGGLFVTQAFTITVTAANVAPQITTTAVTTATVGVAYSYDVNATDANGDTLTYSLTQSPTGMTINASTGLIAWTPTAAQAGSQAVTVRVADPGGLFVTQAFSVAVTAANVAPQITTTAVTTAAVGVAYSYDVNATDANGDTLSYSLTQAPTGMTINGSSGLIAWTPTAAQAGSQAVTVRVADPGGLFVTQAFTVTVTAANVAPQITTTAVTTASVGVAYSYDVNATDANGGTLTYSLTQAPTGMTINATTGLIAWTPTAAQAGNQAVTVRVTDPGGLFVTQAFTITVTAANVAPQITTTAVTTASVGAAYSYDVNATDANGGTLTYSLTQAPTGMTISATTGLIAWTPTAAQAGSQAVTVRVTDPGGLFVTQPFTITVAGGTAPSTTRVDLATPNTYSAARGGTVVMTLNWYRVRMAANYLQFMHLENAAGTVWSVDDHNTTSASWTTAPFSETRTITVPANMPVGTYDIRVGLSGGNPWTDLTLVPGTGVTDPDGSHRYKVGTLTVR
jgi:glucose/arabinose dehydrogenase